MAGLLEKTYSDALFQLAIEENSLEKTFEELRAISDIFSKNSEFEKALIVPTITVSEKLAVIENIFKSRVSELVYNFISVLVEKGRISYNFV